MSGVILDLPQHPDRLHGEQHHDHLQRQVPPAALQRLRQERGHPPGAGVWDGLLRPRVPVHAAAAVRRRRHLVRVLPLRLCAVRGAARLGVPVPLPGRGGAGPHHHRLLLPGLRRQLHPR